MANNIGVKDPPQGKKSKWDGKMGLHMSFGGHNMPDSNDWNICLWYFGYIHHQLLPHLQNMSEKLFLPTGAQTPIVLFITKKKTEPFHFVYTCSHAI